MPRLAGGRSLAAAFGLLVTLLASACAPKPDPAEPALWEVRGPKDEIAWLFGTIHSLEKPADWRSPRLDDALRRADSVVVEIRYPGTDGDSQAWPTLSKSPDQLPLSARVRPALRGELAALLAKGGKRESDFADVETWAAALILARIGDESEAGYGIDRAVVDAAAKPQIELEGVWGQLGIFDTLPEKEQRDLLNLVVGDKGGIDDDSAELAATWRKGDMQTIERETRTGLLADPELREALFTARNRAWTQRIAAMLERGGHPFIAVGAAHMAGSEGLPAMLAAKGYRVTRVQ